MTRDGDRRLEARLAVLERDVAVCIADSDVDPAAAIDMVVADSDFVTPDEQATVTRALRERMLGPTRTQDRTGHGDRDGDRDAGVNDGVPATQGGVDRRCHRLDERAVALTLPECPKWCSENPDPDDGEWVCFACYAEADRAARLPLDEVVIVPAPR